MSIEYEDRIIQERAEDEKKERLRNRKNERKHRKRRLRLTKIHQSRYRFANTGHAAEGRNGKEYVQYWSDSDNKRDLKRISARRTRRREDIPDGNAYRKYEDRWSHD